MIVKRPGPRKGGIGKGTKSIAAIRAAAGKQKPKGRMAASSSGGRSSGT